MGTFLDKPKTDKHNEEGGESELRLRYVVASMQGWRVEMEDAHSAVTGLEVGGQRWAYFGVYDGHAGSTVADQCAQRLLSDIMASEEFKGGDYKRAMRQGFLDFDTKLRQLPEIASGQDKSGSTAVSAFVTPDKIYIANCGDSRAVICSGEKAVLGTRDHKPTLAQEKSRIEKAGGTVTIQRVNGLLAVSRALGDFEYKGGGGSDQALGQCDQLVSPEPELYVHERTPEDQFLVLACDGIWDVTDNQQLCSLILHLVKCGKDLTTAANIVLDTCLSKGSKDNMSLLIVAFPGLPTPCQEAMRAEKEAERAIAASVKNVMENMNVMDVLHLMFYLEEEGIPNLPPGGVATKRPLIEKLFKEYRSAGLGSGADSTGACTPLDDSNSQ